MCLDNANDTKNYEETTKLNINDHKYYYQLPNNCIPPKVQTLLNLVMGSTLADFTIT